MKSARRLARRSDPPQPGDFGPGRPQPEVWNVMTRTRGGTVSLLKNLTEAEARGVMQRLRRPHDEGDPWSDHALAKLAAEQARRERWRRENPDGWPPVQLGAGRLCTKDDLVQIECWGPPGVKLEVWPRPDDWAERFERALEAARREVEETEAAPA